MLYILAILLPPVAVLLAGGTWQFLLNILLTLIGYIPGQIHAVLVVAERSRRKRALREVSGRRPWHRLTRPAHGRRGLAGA